MYLLLHFRKPLKKLNLTCPIKETKVMTTIWTTAKVTKNRFRPHWAVGVNHKYISTIPANERPYEVKETTTRPNHLTKNTKVTLTGGKDIYGLKNY